MTADPLRVLYSGKLLADFNIFKQLVRGAAACKSVSGVPTLLPLFDSVCPPFGLRPPCALPAQEIRHTGLGNDTTAPHTLLHGPMYGFGDDEAALVRRHEVMKEIRTFSQR